jgi:hypothetical protein
VNSFIALKILAQLLATPLGVFVCGLVAAAVLILFRMPRLGRLSARWRSRSSSRFRSIPSPRP